MNAETLRFRLWRCLWVQGHAFDAPVDLGESERQSAFALAVEEQKLLTDEAERAGFSGLPTWVEEYSLAALAATPEQRLAGLEVVVS